MDIIYGDEIDDIQEDTTSMEEKLDALENKPIVCKRCGLLKSTIISNGIPLCGNTTKSHDFCEKVGDKEVCALGVENKEWDERFAELFSQNMAGSFHKFKGDYPTLYYRVISPFISQVEQSAIERTKREILEEIEKMKIPVDKMQHDLRGNCDFERNHTLGELVMRLKIN